MTTEILRSMLYRGADLVRDIEWYVPFDPIRNSCLCLYVLLLQSIDCVCCLLFVVCIGYHVLCFNPCAYIYIYVYINIPWTGLFLTRFITLMILNVV